MAVPSLRFKGFNTEWEVRKLGQLMTITSASRVHKEQWTESGIPFFRSSDVVASFKGTENTKAYISEDLYKDLIKKSGRTKKNDLLVTGGGSIGIPFLIKDDQPLYFKDADLLWLKNADEINGYFLYSYFTTELFRRYLKSIAHIGTIAHYTVVQAQNTPIRLPSLPEQRKIADFLSAVDEKIRLLTEKKQKLETYKKGVMQKLFPKQGQTNPELRFKRPDGTAFPDWEEKRLGDLCADISYGMNASARPYDGENGYLRITDIDDKSRRLMKEGLTSPDDDLEEDYLLQESDILFARTGASTGKSYIYKLSDGKLYFAGFLIRCRLKTGDPDFIYQQTLTSRFEKWVGVMSMRSGQPGINSKEYASFKVDYPCLEEQQMISQFLKKLDAQRMNIDQAIDKMKDFKKGLLQQMFV